jgi:L-fuconolactonase
VKLVGIRHPAHDEPDPEWLVRPSVVDGIGIVAGDGLVFELLVRTRELPAAWRLASGVPDAAFVIDHLAKPGPSPDAAWSEWMRRLAALPNVSVKLSGLVTEGSWSAWQRDDFQAQTSFALEEFGPDRLLFGSDWPVCRLAASYSQVVELAVGLLSGTDDAEQRLVFGENAARIYGLRAA